MQVLCLYGPRKSKPTVKNELRKQQYKTVTLSDCNHLAHVKVLWQIQKFMLPHRFCFFTLYLRGNFQVQAPGDLYSEGRFNGGIFAFALRVWGTYTWRGLFSEFYGIWEVFVFSVLYIIKSSITAQNYARN